MADPIKKKVIRVGHIKSLTPKKFVFLSKDALEDIGISHIDSFFNQHRPKKVSLANVHLKDYGMNRLTSALQTLSPCSFDILII